MQNKKIQFTIGKQVVRSGAVLGALIACLNVNADHLNASTSSSDARFVKEAAKGGEMEVKLGQLGSDKSSNADIKSFGERLVKDHSKANEELMKIAQEKGIDLTKTADHQAHEINTFSNKNGSDFDKAYIKHMVSDHEKDIAKFEKEASQSNDAEIKAFAEKTLPTLREHLRMAQDIARSLGITTASYSTRRDTYSTSDNTAAGAGATVTTGSDRSNPSLNVNTGTSVDKTSQGSVNIHTGEKGDGKTLGLNTQKDDGKFLGVVPDPIHKDHSASVDVNTDKSVGSSSVNVDTGRNSASTRVDTSTDKDASISANTDARPKTHWFSTDKNDGKLWGIFPAPHHKNRNPGVSMDVNANTDGTAAGSPPSTSSGNDRSNP